MTLSGLDPDPRLHRCDVALAKPIGLWLYALYEGRRTPFHAVLGPVERGFYELAGIDPKPSRAGARYARAHDAVQSGAASRFTYPVLQAPGIPADEPARACRHQPGRCVQHRGQLHHQHQLAVVFGGESAMSNLSQMLGLTIHNFTSAATGIALAFAFIRGFARREARGIGNFWADVTRVTLYLLLPVCVVYALVPVAMRRAADVGLDGRRHHARRRQADASCSARSPRRKRSRCSAPTAAASSTPTRRTRSRTRPR